MFPSICFLQTETNAFSMARICQMLRSAGTYLRTEFKKDKSCLKGSLWLSSLVITGVFLALFAAAGAFFLGMSILAIPFGAPSAALAYFSIVALTVPAILFLTAVAHQSYKSTRHHFAAEHIVFPEEFGSNLSRTS